MIMDYRLNLSTKNCHAKEDIKQTVVGCYKYLSNENSKDIIPLKKENMTFDP